MRCPPPLSVERAGGLPMNDRGGIGGRWWNRTTIPAAMEAAQDPSTPLQHPAINPDDLFRGFQAPNGNSRFGFKSM